MQLHLINYFLASETMHALFWTLVHSVWQGILLALIAAIIIMNTKKSGAVLRYKLLNTTLFLFVIASFFTFCYEINFSFDNGKAISFVANNTIAATADINPGNRAGVTEKIILFFQSGEDLFVMIWCLIIILKCLSLVTGLKKIHKLKHSGVYDAGEYWNNRLQELADKIGVTKPVILLKSVIAEIPMAMGYLKPVILFPAAALTALAPAEIEAILLHELAHIRRKDYLVNLLQNLVEIIYFFNPAVLWISSLIKDERENCCDDIAISEVKNKKQFIHALVSFQEYNIAAKYASSFSGRKGHLFNRVKRIITNNNKTLNNMEKIFLVSGIIITGFMAVAFTQHKQTYLPDQIAVVKPVKPVVSISRKDTLSPAEINDNESKTVISKSIDGKQYRLIEMNGKVSELYVDNSKIPGDKISEYKPVIDKLHQQIKEDRAKQTEQMKAQQETLAEQAELMNKNAVAMKEEMEKQADKMKLEQKEIVPQMELMKQNQELMKEDMEKRTAEIKLQSRELMEKAETIKKEQLMSQMEMMKQNDKAIKTDMDKQAEQMKLQSKVMEAQAKLMSQKALMMKDQIEKQAEQMSAQKDVLAAQAELMQQKELMMKDQMQKQTEEVKEQLEYLKQQLIEKRDSIDQIKPTEPKEALKPL